MAYTGHFVGRLEKYEMNLAGSAKTYARKAFMQSYWGLDSAVAIFRDKALLALLTVEDATRLSNELVDAVEEHETGVRATYEPRDA